MNDIIRLLPDSVANQIAAGEVIQRPASVVKELVENAVDAGATRIDIIIKDAGRTLIQVVDDGCGMSDTDARLAFERHATSKISSAADLFSLHTMGFRGEALASIAAVAHIDLRTMLHEAQIGTRLVIKGSVVESQEPEVCVPGSNMMVKNLFFNVPARRRFLKKDSVEFANIMREFERLALVNPDKEISLIHNDTLLHRLMKGSFKQRITELFGKSLEKQLIPVETSTGIVRISGFVGLPQYSRRRNALQYFTVNGRNMRHPYFHKALTGCYASLIAADEQPLYFIDFQVDPSTIDVNIHPTKSEIKFEDEPAIWQILIAAVKESLGRFNAGEGIDFDRADAPEIPAFAPDRSAVHGVELDPGYNPFAQTSASCSRGASPAGSYRNDALKAAGSDWARLYEEFSGEKADGGIGVAPSALNSFDGPDDNDERGGIFSPEEIAGTATCIQLKNTYILTAGKSGALVIDQHRAHVRVLFDRFMESLDSGNITSQKLLFPETLTLSPAQNAMLSAISADVAALGFDVVNTGNNVWRISGVPPLEVSPADTLLKIIEDAGEEGEDSAQMMKRKAALTLARAAAIKPGRSLAQAEMEALVADLFSLSTPNYTPDGKITVRVISAEDIARLFA